MQKKISEANLATAIIGALSGTVKYLDDAELSSVGVVRKTFLDAVDEMYQGRDKAKSDDARRYVVGAITNINTKAELRYRSIEGIIEPLAKYIDVNKEERRDGANTGNGDGQGNEQTSLSQTGGGAEDVLQSLINQNDSDVNGMLGSIANDMSAPQSNRNKRLSNLAKDEYYKRNARPLPVKSPTIEAETREIGKLRTPVKVSERILTPDQLHELPMEAIMQFQQETGIICLSQRSQYQWVYEIYEWEEQPIIDFEYKQTGIILPENIIIRVDGSGSMGGTVFVGKNNSYDCLMHVVYGIMKSVAEAAKSVSKEVQVVGVNYSKHGKTRVSDAVELQTFYDTPNNSAKEVLLNPEGGSTYHDLSAYQEAHRKCKPGKTVEIIITDGDLNSDHDQTMTEIKKIIDSGNTVMLYLPIFQEGAFAQRMKQLARLNANVTYRAFLNFGQIQATVDGILIQYSQRT